MFPLFDIWRLAILEPTVSQATLTLFVKVQASISETVSLAPLATFLTLLLTTNALGTPRLSRSLLLPAGGRCSEGSGSAHEPAGAEGPSCARTKGGGDDAVDGIWADEEDGEWEVELVSAVVETLAGEEESEDAGELYVSCARPVIAITITITGAEGSSPNFYYSSAPTDSDVGILDPAVAFL